MPNVAHDEDVIFTQDSLIEFIKAIKQDTKDTYHFVSIADMIEKKSKNFQNPQFNDYESEINIVFSGGNVAWDSAHIGEFCIINKQVSQIIQDNDNGNNDANRNSSRYTWIRGSNLLKFSPIKNSIPNNDPSDNDFVDFAGTFQVNENNDSKQYSVIINGFSEGNFDNYEYLKVAPTDIETIKNTDGLQYYKQEITNDNNKIIINYYQLQTDDELNEIKNNPEEQNTLYVSGEKEVKTNNVICDNLLANKVSATTLDISGNGDNIHFHPKLLITNEDDAKRSVIMEEGSIGNIQSYSLIDGQKTNENYNFLQNIYQNEDVYVVLKNEEFTAATMNYSTYRYTRNKIEFGIITNDSNFIKKNQNDIIESIYKNYLILKTTKQTAGSNQNNWSDTDTISYAAITLTKAQEDNWLKQEQKEITKQKFIGYLDKIQQGEVFSNQINYFKKLNNNNIVDQSYGEYSPNQESWFNILHKGLYTRTFNEINYSTEQGANTYYILGDPIIGAGVPMDSTVWNTNYNNYYYLNNDILSPVALDPYGTPDFTNTYYTFTIEGNNAGFNKITNMNQSIFNQYKYNNQYPSSYPQYPFNEFYKKDNGNMIKVTAAEPYNSANEYYKRVSTNINTYTQADYNANQSSWETLIRNQQIYRYNADNSSYYKITITIPARNIDYAIYTAPTILDEQYHFNNAVNLNKVFIADGNNYTRYYYTAYDKAKSYYYKNNDQYVLYPNNQNDWNYFCYDHRLDNIYYTKYEKLNPKSIIKEGQKYTKISDEDFYSVNITAQNWINEIWNVYIKDDTGSYKKVINTPQFDSTVTYYYYNPDLSGTYRKFQDGELTSLNWQTKFSEGIYIKLNNQYIRLLLNNFLQNYNDYYEQIPPFDNFQYNGILIEELNTTIPNSEQTYRDAIIEQINNDGLYYLSGSDWKKVQSIDDYNSTNTYYVLKSNGFKTYHGEKPEENIWHYCALNGLYVQDASGNYNKINMPFINRNRNETYYKIKLSNDELIENTKIYTNQNEYDTEVANGILYILQKSNQFVINVNQENNGYIEQQLNEFIKVQNYLEFVDKPNTTLYQKIINDEYASLELQPYLVDYSYDNTWDNLINQSLLYRYKNIYTKLDYETDYQLCNELNKIYSKDNKFYVIGDSSDTTNSNNEYDPAPGYGLYDANVDGSIATYGGISARKAIKGFKIHGAVFNDYAEYRHTNNISPGRCVIETGNGDLILAEKRLQLGANIISDTYGFSIGETKYANTPIAVCGRVLAYPYEYRQLFRPGEAVCSGPNGTVSRMTRDEIKNWPDAIIGYVSEVPEYDEWGSDNIKVDGRIWIKVH